MIRIFLAVAAAVLLLGGPAAHAATFTSALTSDYLTSYQVPEAPNTNTYGDGGNTDGGLCTPTTSGGICPGNSLVNSPTGSKDLSGGTTSSSGLIVFTVPPVGMDGLLVGQSWLMTISVEGNQLPSRTGDIYEATYCSGTATFCAVSSNYQVLLTTSAACLSGGAGQSCTNTSNNTLKSTVTSGAATVPATPGATYYIGITDLLEQYLPSTVCSPSPCIDNLPGELPAPLTNAALDGGTPSSGYNTDILQFTMSLTAVPEPASLALLGGAVALLGAARRGRRGPRPSMG